MGYDLIIQLASEFRRALETVAAKESMEDYHYLHTFQTVAVHIQVIY